MVIQLIVMDSCKSRKLLTQKIVIHNHWHVDTIIKNTQMVMMDLYTMHANTRIVQKVKLYILFPTQFISYFLISNRRNQPLVTIVKYQRKAQMFFFLFQKINTQTNFNNNEIPIKNLLNMKNTLKNQRKFKDKKT